MRRIIAALADPNDGRFTRESHATLELKPQADRDAWPSVKLRLGDRERAWMLWAEAARAARSGDAALAPALVRNACARGWDAAAGNRRAGQLAQIQFDRGLGA